MIHLVPPIVMVSDFKVHLKIKGIFDITTNTDIPFVLEILLIMHLALLLLLQEELGLLYMDFILMIIIMLFMTQETL